MPIATENKAKLMILKSTSGKDVVVDHFNVQFNPEQYSKSWELSWQEVGQTLQWTKTTPAAFNVTLRFDTYEERTDVSDRTKQIRDLLDPSKGKHGCLFQWGKVVFKGVVKTIKEDFTLFLQDGKPVRSTLTLTLQPWPGDLQNP